MGKLRTLWARVKGQAAQSREDEAFSDEIREHIKMLTERYRGQGLSAEDAAHTAGRLFGNVTSLRERQRMQRGILSPMELWRDLCFGMRVFRKRIFSNAAVVLALALGIGMNTAVFTFVAPALAVGFSTSQVAGFCPGATLTAHLNNHLQISDDEQDAPLWTCPRPAAPWASLWRSLRVLG